MRRYDHPVEIPEWGRVIFHMLLDLHQHAEDTTVTLSELKAQLSDTVSQSREQTKAFDAFGVFVSGLKTSVDDLTNQVADLKAQVAAGGGVSPADIQDISAGLSEISKTLADERTREAVLEGTEVDPNAPPAEPVVPANNPDPLA